MAGMGTRKRARNAAAAPPTLPLPELSSSPMRKSPAPSNSNHTVPLQKRHSFCGRMFAFTIFLALFAATGLVGGAVRAGRPLTVQGISQPFNRVSFFFMRLARDMSRAKARRRRFGQPNALTTLMMGKEELLPLADVDSDSMIALTAEELAEFDGRLLIDSTEHAPLYLAVRGRIYDVTAGGPFYGQGKSYHKLVGKDASRAFCTGCLEEACLIPDMSGLTDAQRREADRWVELYEHHDKYKLVGRLRQGDASSEPDDESAVERLLAAQQAEGSDIKRKPFRPR